MHFQRQFSLTEIDEQWIEHLKTMDALREGIGLQGYGQKDPKKEYKRIGFDLFAEMMGRIQQNTVTKVFRVHIQREEEAVPAVKEKEREMAEGAEAKGETVRRDKPKVGRNDPCPCGSGKKYKKCHGKDEEAAATE